MEKRLINGEKLEKLDVRSRKTGFGMGLFTIFTIVCVLFAMSFVAAADSTGKLQIWRNKTTGTNVGWIDNNGNVNFGGVISGDGSGITNLNIDVAAINYWNKSGNNLFYNDGNVGIGTASPNTLLDVNGSSLGGAPLIAARFSNYAPYSGGNGQGPVRIELGRGSRTHGYIESGSISDTDSSSGYLAFGNRQKVNEINEAMRIGPLGNVGIGTTNPGAKLEVAQGNILLSNGRALSWKNSAGTKINLIKYDNANNLIVNNGNSAAGRIDLEIGSKKRLSIDGDKVGINNENPTKELDVNGTAKVEELNVKNARMFIDSEGDMVFRV